jgi:hypothetical protein
MSAYGFIKLTEVEARHDYTLLVTFETGERKLYDFKPELDYKVFSPLKNPGLFMQAKNGGYAVIWNDKIDIASEELYHHGVPVAENDAGSGDYTDEREELLAGITMEDFLRWREEKKAQEKENI